MALLRTNGRANKPMFYISLIDQYHGLSSRGVDVRAAYQSGLSRKSYKGMKEEALRTYTAKYQEAIRKGLGVGVADNYNKQYYVSKVDAKQQGLQNENRCVAALSVIPDHLEIKAGNRDLDSLPRPDALRPFIPAAMEAIRKAIIQRRTPGSDPNDWKFYEGAQVTEHKVYCVPLKMPPEVVQEREMPPHDIGLTNFRPLFIHASNPASNKGCFEMIQDLYEAFGPMYRNGHYIPLRFDVNIYNMFLRVLSLFSF